MDTMRRVGLAGAVLAIALACDAEPLDGGYPEPTPFPAAIIDGCRPAAPRLVALDKRKLTVPLGGGLATNFDDKLLPNGKLLSLQNSRAARTGETVKRTGTGVLGTGLLGTTDVLPEAWAMGTLGGCLVSFSVVGDHPANMYSPTALQWATDATNGPIKTGRRGSIVATPARVTGVGHYADMATASGYYFIAARGGPSGTETVVETIIDIATGAKVAERTYTDVTSVFNLGVRVVNGYAVFVRDTTANDLKFDAWQISNLDAGPTTQTFATTTGSTRTQTFDLLVKDATTISVVYTDGTNAQAVDFVPSLGTTSGWTPKDSAAANIPVGDSIAWMQDFGAAGKIALVVQSGAAVGVKVHWDIPTVGVTRQAVSSYVMDAATTTSANVAGYTRGSSATGEFTVLYDNTSGPMKAATRTGGVIFSGGTYYFGVAMRSRPWQQGSSYYIIGEFNSTTQTTRYVLQLPPSGAATTATPLAITQVRTGLPTGPLSSSVNPSADTWVSANTVQVKLPSNPTGYAPSDTGIETLTVSFKQASDTTTGAPREAIGSLFAPGGALGQFDGSTYAEAGFAYYPEQPTLTPNAGGANTYWYKLVYSYSDASGRLWRSADSIAKSTATAAVIGGGGSVTVACPTLRLTGRSDVTIEVYRGALNDSVTFQKIGTVANSVTVDTVNFPDAVTDATLASGEFLYTNGATGSKPLANDAIPGFTSIAIANNRLFGISADDPSVIWASNKFVDGQGLRFSEQTRVTIRDQHGPIYALAAMPDGRVLAFKSDAVYVISGDGPNPVGQGSYSVSIVAIGLGTTNPRSVVETGQGAMFQSTSTRSGIYRIGLSLGEEYIGAPVQRYTGSPVEKIVGAVLVPSKQEVRFYQTRLTSSSRVLVMDLVTGIWNIDTMADIPTAATAYGDGAAYYGTVNNDAVITDSTSLYTDLGAAYEHMLETPWVKLAELKGYARTYRIKGVGETVGTHTLTIALYKNFDTSAPFVTQVVTPGTLWDWEVRYGAKFESIKAKLSYSSTTAGAKMSAIVIEYGVETARMPKGPASKRAA